MFMGEDFDDYKADTDMDRSIPFSKKKISNVLSASDS